MLKKFLKVLSAGDTFILLDHFLDIVNHYYIILVLPEAACFQVCDHLRQLAHTAVLMLCSLMSCWVVLFMSA